jgi:hypothetical protein
VRWTGIVEVNEKRPLPPGAATAAHRVDDVVLRARRHASGPTRHSDRRRLVWTLRCRGYRITPASARRLTMELGYFLSSEEHGPRQLLHQAQLAEQAGIESVWISDHFHPWLDEQGESPFVWSVIGAIAATTRLRVATAVTCPTIRIHPAVIAHAAGRCIERTRPREAAIDSCNCNRPKTGACSNGAS